MNDLQRLLRFLDAWIAPKKIAGAAGTRGIAVRAGHHFEFSQIRLKENYTIVGERGDDDGGDVGQGRFIVQRSIEAPAGFGQYSQPLVKLLVLGDVGGDRANHRPPVRRGAYPGGVAYPDDSAIGPTSAEFHLEIMATEHSGCILSHRAIVVFFDNDSARGIRLLELIGGVPEKSFRRLIDVSDFRNRYSAPLPDRCLQAI